MESLKARLQFHFFSFAAVFNVTQLFSPLLTVDFYSNIQVSSVIGQNDNERKIPMQSIAQTLLNYHCNSD
jgi:hypothetical protein